MAAIAGLEDCFFYHSMDLPGLGLVRGQWDLRGTVNEDLGGLSFAGQRVLEIGPASGFLTFEMERRGAHVTACELPDGARWDLVPYVGMDLGPFVSSRNELQRRLHNGFWFAHRAHGSRSRVVYHPVYELPDDVGRFDVATLSMVLLHLREPFRALERVLAHVDRTVLITEPVPCELMPEDMRREISPRASLDHVSMSRHGVISDETAARIAALPAVAAFSPDPVAQQPKESWWRLTPSVLFRFLGVLGFRVATARYYFQAHDPAFQWTKPKDVRSVVTYHPCITIVAERAAPGSSP